METSRPSRLPAQQPARRQSGCANACNESSSSDSSPKAFRRSPRGAENPSSLSDPLYVIDGRRRRAAPFGTRTLPKLLLNCNGQTRGGARRGSPAGRLLPPPCASGIAAPPSHRQRLRVPYVVADEIVRFLSIQSLSRTDASIDPTAVWPIRGGLHPGHHALPPP